jgi:hypothetical protein
MSRSFPNNLLGWKAYAGVRANRWVGGELEYLDFGGAHLGPAYYLTENGMPLEPDEFYGASERSQAAAALAVVYLPLRVSWLDVFGKLGAAHLWTSHSASGYYPNTFLNCATMCVPVGHVSESQSDSSNGLAYGGGVQARFGALGLRLEYERISSDIGQPYMVSLGANWTFGVANHAASQSQPAATTQSGYYYVGASVGQSSFETDFFSYAGGPAGFHGESLGWKVLLGARPLSFLGAEIEYIDFGETHSGAIGEITSASGEARGGAAFAVGYLPMPTPNIDVFGKLGAARYRVAYRYSGNFPNTCIVNPATGQCTVVGQATVSGASDATGLAYGIGAQYHFGSFAVRAEMEKFSTTESSTAPSLLSVGLTYRF